MISRFCNNDKEYENWCDRNKNGYVFNYFGGTANRSDMNKVHKVTCPSLWRKTDEGRRTTKYEKVCSNHLDELIEFVNQERGKSWSYCKGSRCLTNMNPQ